MRRDPNTVGSPWLVKFSSVPNASTNMSLSSVQGLVERYCKEGAFGVAGFLGHGVRPGSGEARDCLLVDRIVPEKRQSGWLEERLDELLPNMWKPGRSASGGCAAGDQAASRQLRRLRTHDPPDTLDGAS